MRIIQDLVGDLEIEELKKAGYQVEVLFRDEITGLKYVYAYKEG